MSFTDHPTPGRHQCPQCEKYIGVRSRKCPNCGKEFAPVKKKLSAGLKAKLKSAAPKKRADGSMILTQVLVPADPCPVKLDSMELQDISKWISQVQAAGMERGEIYTAETFCYFAREYFDIFTETYRDVCNKIREAYASK